MFEKLPLFVVVLGLGTLVTHERAVADECSDARPFAVCDGGKPIVSTPNFVGAICSSENIASCVFSATVVCKGEKAVTTNTCGEVCPAGCKLNSRVRGRFCGNYEEKLANVAFADVTDRVCTQAFADSACAEKLKDQKFLDRVAKSFEDHCGAPRTSVTDGTSDAYCEKANDKEPVEEPTEELDQRSVLTIDRLESLLTQQEETVVR